MVFSILFVATLSVEVPSMSEFDALKSTNAELMALLNSTRAELENTKTQLSVAFVAIDGLSQQLTSLAGNMATRQDIQDRKHWNSLDTPVVLGSFNWDNPGEILNFELPIDGETIPLKCQEVLINVVLRSGNETPNAWYHVDLWTVTDNASKNLKRIRGWHYRQSAISFNSENMWFPVEPSSTKLYYQVEDTAHDNCHGGQVLVMGWR